MIPFRSSICPIMSVFTVFTLTLSCRSTSANQKRSEKPSDLSSAKTESQGIQEFLYNSDDQDPLSPSAVPIENGKSHIVYIDAGRKVERIDVRWGDEKSRINGVTIDGLATGWLTVNDQVQGSQRSLPGIETQAWPTLTYPSSTDGRTKIEIFVTRDSARIHWIRAHYSGEK